MCAPYLLPTAHLGGGLALVMCLDIYPVDIHCLHSYIHPAGSECSREQGHPYIGQLLHAAAAMPAWAACRHHACMGCMPACVGDTQVLLDVGALTHSPERALGQ